jgi:hypothetical protein
MPRQPTDRNGKVVSVGDLVRVISLSGDWFDNLPSDERERVESMIGEVLAVEEIDEYGQPWVCKWWRNTNADTAQSRSVALEPSEMEFVSGHSE